MTFREGLEAALVVGILARYVRREERMWLWGGILTAILLSLIAAVALSRLTAAHQLWEVIFSALAAGMLLYMVIWMRRRSGTLSQELRNAAQTSSGWLLFGLSLTTILREGLETVLFLRTLWSMQKGLSWVGGLLGLLAALITGILLFIYGRRVPLRSFFNITSVLLLLIAAGMASYAVHELLELLEPRYAWAEKLADAKAWSLFTPETAPPTQYAWAYTFYEGKYYPLLHHKGWLGGVLHVLTGWRASMAWMELLTWGAVFGGGLYLWRRVAITHSQR